MANPKGRPKVENKWAWIVSESGVIPVEVRKHQGVYKTFMYDTEKQRTSFLREVKTPVFNSLEEANKNAPTFEGFNEDFLGVKEGGPRFYESKYGYELSPDMKLSIVEYRFNPASGARKEGYRRYKYNDAGQATLGRLAPGELFESPQQGIDDWNSNYSNGKLIDWQAFDDAQADLAAREPSPEEVERYYGQDMPTYDDASYDYNYNKEIEKLTEKQIDDYYKKGITDGLSDDQRSYLYFKDQAEAYADVMDIGDDDFNDARPEKQIARQDMPTIDDAKEKFVQNYIADNPNIDPKIANERALTEFDTRYSFEIDQAQGTFNAGKIEAGTMNYAPTEGFYGGEQRHSAKVPTPPEYKNELDLYNAIEAKNNIPKGSISKVGLALDPIAEGLEFALKGIGLGSVAQWWVKAEAANFLAGLIRGGGAASGIAQLGQSQALMGEEFTADADAIKNAFAQNLGSQMKLSPSLWMENKYAESDLGKGETPSQQAFGWVKNMFGASQ